MYYRSSLPLQLASHRLRPATAPPWVMAAALWITVSLSLCFGYYGNRHLVLGPNSSRMLAVSSVFVKQIQVSNAANEGLLLYGFPAIPELISSGSNWTVSKKLSVGPYSRRGFSLWLNTGSVIRIRWDVVGGGGNIENLKVVLFKGERNLQLLQQYSTSFHSTGGRISNGTAYGADVSGEGQAEYSVEQDDNYYVGAANMNSHVAAVSMAVEASSKTYDITGATSMCSTNDGPCKMEMGFPRTQYVVLATPTGDDPDTAWYVELSFVARLMTYFGIVGLIAVVLWIFLRRLHACSEEGITAVQREETQQDAGNAETDPIVTRKETPCTYGAMEEDCESAGSCHPSEDLYDGKICVICYEERRSCFFTPCGHCVTCYACGKRIIEEENKVCPICRRLIHKVRRLLHP